MNFISKIERLANQKTLILGLVITIVSLAMMQLIMGELLTITGGLQVMDLRFSYTMDDVEELLTAMGETGRLLYNQMQIADTFFPLGMLLVIVNVIVSLTSRVFPKGSPYRVFVLIPFIVLLFSFILDIPLFAHLSIGGHPWYVVVGAFATSTFMFCMNLPFLIRTLRGRG